MGNFNFNDVIKVQSGCDILNQFDNTETTPKKIFGEFLYEGELGVFFGDSNAGKSIAANDIAFFVSGGGYPYDFCECPKLASLYIDMEMSAKQFATRYKGIGIFLPKHYSRAEVNVLDIGEKKVFAYVKSLIISAQSWEIPPKFIIIDNITNGFGSIFSAARMREIISGLKGLKEKFGLTILLIAHCPKRKAFEPLTQNSLGGSKMILNFVDSAFAIGCSRQGEDVRYIKQVKTRVGVKHSDVLGMQIVNEPYLHMIPNGWMEESAHLENETDWFVPFTPEQEIEIVKLLIETELSYGEIAAKIGVSKNRVELYVEHYLS